MQSVNAAFTAEERDSVRSIAHNLMVSWKKDSILGNRTFTIGVSTIGGGDVVGINPGAVGSPGQWRYFDESDYVMSLGWEYSLNFPTGGLSVGMAEAELDNTSGRFLPEYMGGNSELFTAILPRRPMIINGGFDVGGVDITVPQFSGILNRTPQVNIGSRTVGIQAADYVDFFSNRFMDQEAMYTGITSDTVMENLLLSMGLSTAQYELDPGINPIPFVLLEKGSRYSEIFHQLAEAENGQFYQDEEGVFKFENRQHWDSSPGNEVQRILTTSQVIDAEAPDIDNIINVVEIRSDQIVKQPTQVVMNYNTPHTLAPGERLELWFNYDDPMLQVITPTAGGSQSYFVANANDEETGTDYSTSVTLVSIDNFSKASKLIFKNNASVSVVLLRVVLSGRPAKKIAELYTRLQDDSSVTAYEERTLTIDNPFIQDTFWPSSYAQLLLNDYGEPDKIQKIKIRAIPELQRGDLVSWQGRYWRVYGIKTKLSPSVGYIQELTMLQRTVASYFRIGISTIGGTDMIAP